MSYEYDLVGQLVKRAVEVGEGWDDNKLMNAAAERIVRQEAEIVRLRLALGGATSKVTRYHHI